MRTGKAKYDYLENCRAIFTFRNLLLEFVEPALRLRSFAIHLKNLEGAQLDHFLNLSVGQGRPFERIAILAANSLVERPDLKVSKITSEVVDECKGVGERKIKL